MRRPIGFGGRDAAFDSHSCFSRHENDADFRLDSDRWKRQLHSNVNPQIWASAHENLHWAQFAATGFGNFLNRLRAARDRHIVEALKALPQGRELIDRRLKGEQSPLFDYDTILAKLRNSQLPQSPIEWAVALDLLERSAYLQDGAKYLGDDSVLLNRVVNELNGAASGNTFDTAAQVWPAFEQPLSTEQLLEAQVVLFEYFYLDVYAFAEDEQQQRFADLEATTYYAPIHYALRELYKARTDAQFAEAMQGTGAHAFWISLFICIDLAIDTFFPAPSAGCDVMPIDWCPPLRFRDLIEAVRRHGLIAFNQIDHEWTNSRAVFLDYRERLKSLAKLRTSTDHDFEPVGDYAEFEAVSRMRFEPSGGLRHLLEDVDLYEVVSRIQALLHEKKRAGVGYLHDPILNLSHDNAPVFMNFYDPDDFRLSCFSGPPNICYANGTIGRSASLPVFAAQVLQSSFASYPLFALAFEHGALQASPWRLADTINMSGQTPVEFFGASLRQRLDGLTASAAAMSASTAIGCEEIILQRARHASLERLEEIKSDWSAYQRIAAEEGHLPVTIELKADFLANHSGINGLDLERLLRGDVICYLQQQCWLEDGSTIGLKVHLIDDPEQLLRLNMMVKCRIQLSGKLLSRAFRESSARWLGVFHDAPLSVLIDADIKEIMEMLSPTWEWLTWTPTRVEGSRAPFLLVYPIGEKEPPPIALFRPLSANAAGGLLDMLGLFSFPAYLKDQGVPIFGMTDAQRNAEWEPPDFLLNTVRRYCNDAAVFKSL